MLIVVFDSCLLQSDRRGCGGGPAAERAAAAAAVPVAAARRRALRGAGAVSRAGVSGSIYGTENRNAGCLWCSVCVLCVQRRVLGSVRSSIEGLEKEYVSLLT